MVKNIDNSNNKSATIINAKQSNNIVNQTEELAKQQQLQQKQTQTQTQLEACNNNSQDNKYSLERQQTEERSAQADQHTFGSTNFIIYNATTNAATLNTHETLTAPHIPIVGPGVQTIETSYQHHYQPTYQYHQNHNHNHQQQQEQQQQQQQQQAFENFQLENAYRNGSTTTAAASGATLSLSSLEQPHSNAPTATSQNFHELVCQTCSNKFPTELQPEDEERLERIFKKLDRNGDGKIDVHDLSEALHEFGFSRVYAEKFMEHSDKNRSGNLGFAEFLQYVREHEKHLCLQFSHLDKNQDGKVDLEELVSAFKDLGLEVDREEARKLLARMDKDGSLNISYNEWRDFLLMAPSTNIHDLIKFWRHSTYLDIGEDMNVPDDFTQNEMQTGMWWRHLAAGGIAGAVSRTCTAPLDRVKVYLQVQTRKMGISECVKYMLNEGGAISMWRGNGINVVKIAPESAIKFAAYEQMKRLIRGNENRSMSISERFVAGAAAGGISQTIIYPMEVLKTRLALRRTGQYKGIFDAAAKIYHKEGLRSFYRGYVPNIIGILPYAGIDLAVYETLKRKYIASHAGNEQPSFLVLLACGSMSSALGQLCSYPLALVRTRLQAQAALETTQIRRIQIPMKSAEATSEDTMMGLFRKIIQSEGLTGLYRGITPNFLKVLPAVSISYVVYEYSSRALGIKMS